MKKWKKWKVNEKILETCYRKQKRINSKDKKRKVNKENFATKSKRKNKISKRKNKKIKNKKKYRCILVTKQTDTQAENCWHVRKNFFIVIWSIILWPIYHFTDDHWWWTCHD